MREVSGRMFGLCLAAARTALHDGDHELEGLVRGLELPLARPLAPTPRLEADLAGRFGFSTYLTLLERLAGRLGGLSALEDAFAEAAGDEQGLAAFADDFDSPWALAWFVNTVLAPADFTCQHTVMRGQSDEPSARRYELWHVLRRGYTGTEALMHAAIGLLRGQPGVLARPGAEVGVTGSPEEFLCRVTLPAADPARSRATPGTTSGFQLEAVLVDAEAYRDDGDRLSCVLGALGKVNEIESFSEDYARASLQLLRDHFELGHAAIWQHRSGERVCLATAGERSAATDRLALTVAGEVVGELEVATHDGRETLAPLLPILAWGLEARSPAPVRAARLGVADGATIPRGWKLTKRQAEIVSLVAEGLPNHEIAARLGCAVGTVEDRLTAIYEKAGVDGRLAVLVAVLREPGAATS
jgi:DNA-binding CsgD family transcriptional regulator